MGVQYNAVHLLTCQAGRHTDNLDNHVYFLSVMQLLQPGCPYKTSVMLRICQECNYYNLQVPLFIQVVSQTILTLRRILHTWWTHW